MKKHNDTNDPVANSVQAIRKMTPPDDIVERLEALHGQIPRRAQGNRHACFAFFRAILLPKTVFGRAATVAAAVALIAGVVLLSPSDFAVANSLAAMRQADTMICNLTLHMEDRRPVRYSFYWMAPGTLRIDRRPHRGGIAESHWFVDDKITTVLYDHDGTGNKMFVSDRPPHLRDFTRDLLGNLTTEGALKDFFEAEWEAVSENGKLNTAVFQLKPNGQSRPARVTIDTKSGLPTRLELPNRLRSQDGGGGRLARNPDGSIWTSAVFEFQWNRRPDLEWMRPELDDVWSLRPGEFQGIRSIRTHIRYLELVIAGFCFPDKSTEELREIWRQPVMAGPLVTQKR